MDHITLGPPAAYTSLSPSEFQARDFNKPFDKLIFEVRNPNLSLGTKVLGDSVMLTFDVPPLTSGKGLCDIDGVQFRVTRKV